MNVCIITTSRADYGIYHSLLEALRVDREVEYGLVVSGSHFADSYGHTLDYILADNHPIYASVPAVPEDNSPAAVTRTIGSTITAFAEVWERLLGKVDIIIALGDRYEMFAAVTATVPFNLPVAHLHGGESTLGAIDDKFRHAITLMSTLHFPATERYAERIKGLLGTNGHVLAVGAPSMDGLEDMALPDQGVLYDRFGIDFRHPTILVTFHPETVAVAENARYGELLVSTLHRLSADYQIVVTLPNTDTAADVIRNKFLALAQSNNRVFTLESFGKLNYFAALKYCSLLLGNSSSALIEAPSFGKYAVNIGNRQAGRQRNPNVLDVGPSMEAILGAVRRIEKHNYRYSGPNVYVRSGSAGRDILAALKAWWTENAAG